MEEIVDPFSSSSLTTFFSLSSVIPSFVSVVVCSLFLFDSPLEFNVVVEAVVALTAAVDDGSEICFLLVSLSNWRRLLDLIQKKLETAIHSSL